MTSLPIKDRSWLAQEMLDQKMFWSYAVKSPGQIPDPLLIETVLLFGDIPHLNALFKVFTKDTIQSIWENQILIREPRYHDLNVFLGWLYFKIAHPEKYIRHIFSQNNPYERLKREYETSL